MLLNEIRDAVAVVQSGIASGPITPSVTPQEIRSYLASRYDFKKTVSLDEVVADVEKMLHTWQVQVTHPRYFGLFNPSVTLASIVADALAAMYNPQLATWRTSPAANEIERHTLAWLTGKFGFPATAAATFTTGGAEANLSAVIVALTQGAFPDYGERRGLRSRRRQRQGDLPVRRSPPLVQQDRLHMTGVGRQGAPRCPNGPRSEDGRGRSRKTHRRGSQAGVDTVHGRRYCWHNRCGSDRPPRRSGGFLQAGEPLVSRGRCLGRRSHHLAGSQKFYLAGIEAADSITCDAHKWFSVPMGAGMFFCRHNDAVAAAFHAETSYMPRATSGPVTDPYTSSVQWSRRFIGLKLFLALAHYGESGYIDMIEHQTRMGEVLRESLKCAGWRIVNATPLPLVCFTRDGLDTAAFLAALQEQQIAWMTEVRLGNAPPVLRACITRLRTTAADIKSVVTEMSRLTQ